MIIYVYIYNNLQLMWRQRNHGRKGDVTRNEGNSDDKKKNADSGI